MSVMLDLVLSLEDKYNYSEFISSCKKNNVAQIMWTEYASNVTMLDYAMAMNPDMHPLDAYYKEIQDNNNMLTIPKYVELDNGTVTTTYQTSGCGSCGGGQVR